MFEDIMCVLGGFFTAYLIIRLVRSFRGGVGVILLLLWQVGTAQAAYMHCHNVGSVQGSCSREDYNSAAYTTLNYANSSTGYIAPGATADLVIFPSDWTKVYWSANSSSGPGAPFTANLGHVSDGFTFDFDPQSYGSYGVTNQVASWTFTNVLQGVQEVKLSVYDTNGVTKWSTNLMVNPGTFTWSMTNAIGNGVPFTWGATYNPGASGDFMPVTAGGSSFSQTGSSYTSSSNQQLNTYVDPFYNLPPPPSSITSSNQIVQDRLNAQGLANAIMQAMSIEMQYFSGLTNLSSGGGGDGATLTNQLNKLQEIASQATNGNGLLAQIATNTLNTAINALNIATNAAFLPGIYTNSSGIYSNTLGLKPYSYGDITNALGTNWTALTNLVASIIGGATGGFDGAITNDLNFGIITLPGSVPGCMVVPLPPVGGMAYWLDFDLFNSGTTLSATLIAWIPFVRKWLAYGINVALFWAVVYRLDSVMQDSIKHGLVAAKPSSAAGLAGYVAQVAASPVFIAAVGGLLAILPTLALTWLVTWGWSNPYSASAGNDLLQSVADAAGHTGQVMQTYAAGLGLAIPFDVLFLAMTVWTLCFFFTQYYINFIIMCLWVCGLLMPVVVLLLAGDQVRGDQMRFENFSGSSISVSNLDGQVLSFPAGVTDRTVVDHAVWVSGTNGFEVDPSWGVYQVVRAYGDTNFPGMVQFRTSTGYSPYQWWIFGFNGGLIICGTAWAVSAARSGILLRVRE